MKTVKRTQHLKSEKGLATFETLPLLVVFTILIGYGVGFFGVIHTGILNSIAARTYAFDTFRHRTDLTYFRYNGGDNHRHFDESQVRFHLIRDENYEGKDFVPSKRPIEFGKVREEPLGKQTDHNTKIFDLERRNKSVSVAPVWVMVGYGMCINAQCGD